MTRFKSKTLVIPQFVAGEHGLFGGHKSEDIWTFLVSTPDEEQFLFWKLFTYICFVLFIPFCNCKHYN